MKGEECQVCIFCGESWPSVGSQPSLSRVRLSRRLTVAAWVLRRLSTSYPRTALLRRLLLVRVSR